MVCPKDNTQCKQYKGIGAGQSDVDFYDTAELKECPKCHSVYLESKKQADEAERKAMEFKKQKDREDELQRIKNNFDVEFFNNRYGVGKWKRYAFGINRGDELILTEKDLKECAEAFKVKYPQEDKEIEKITENR